MVVFSCMLRAASGCLRIFSVPVHVWISRTSKLFSLTPKNLYYPAVAVAVPSMCALYDRDGSMIGVPLVSSQSWAKPPPCPAELSPPLTICDAATPASKHSQASRRIADKLRGNFIPLGNSAGVSTVSSTINDQRNNRSEMDQRKRTPAKAEDLRAYATPGESREASSPNFTFKPPETPHPTATPGGKGVCPREVMIPLCVGATPSPSSSRADEETNDSGSNQALSVGSGGGSSRQDGAGKQGHDADDSLVSNTLPPVLPPLSQPGAQSSTDGCSVSRGDSLRNGDDGGKVDGKIVGEAEPQVSLLEKIRRDAKKKRRKAAAVSASPGAIR